MLWSPVTHRGRGQHSVAPGDVHTGCVRPCRRAANAIGYVHVHDQPVEPHPPLALHRGNAQGGRAADYEALTERVTLWDTAAERQVEISGPDATLLVRRLTPRNLGSWPVGQCKYMMMCNAEGGIINDPVGLKLAEGHYWLSLADSDMLYWVQGLAIGWGLDVTVTEPDVSPLQVQGPLATQLMRDVVGDWIADLKFFRFEATEIDGAPVVISRTGWSNERGYELFLRDGSHGERLWDHLMAAGERYGIAPCAPNQANRLEAGMLSHGADMDASNNPFEVGLDRLVDLGQEVDFIGKAALAQIAREGVRRRVAGLRIDGAPFAGNDRRWPVLRDGAVVGEVTSAAFSPKAGVNLALGYLPAGQEAPGETFEVATPQGPRGATVIALPAVKTNKKG